ncbi:MAG: haloacid dehalogenase type II [Hyphomicrobiaceae bacterium]
MRSTENVQALLFDVFGTVVDWRSSCIRQLSAFGHGRGIADVDWEAFADRWRGLYQPSMEECRAGRRVFTLLDDLHRESLIKLLGEAGVSNLTADETEYLVSIWHRLTPWPDVVDGLKRLKKRYIIATLSNGNIGLMTRLAKYGGLPWDAILGAEIARAYKPQSEAYQQTAAALLLEPSQCMMVAAHNDDLRAAAGEGYRTAFVVRPQEFGSNQLQDRAADEAWDVTSDSFHGLADAMGCPL